MAITYPRDMPRLFSSQKFELQRVDYLSPTTEGRVGAVTAGWPLWSGSWAFAGMTEAHTQECRAWVSSLRGSQRLFFGADLMRPLPIKGLPSGFNGDAASWAVNATRDVLTLSGVAGLNLSPGDYVGFRWGANGRTKVRVLEQSLDGAAFTVEPPVHNIVPGNAVAYVKKPVCLMRLTPETELGDIGVDRSLTGRIVAIQTLIS